jgi:hypothetical protein
MLKFVCFVSEVASTNANVIACITEDPTFRPSIHSIVSTLLLHSSACAVGTVMPQRLSLLHLLLQLPLPPLPPLLLPLPLPLPLLGYMQDISFCALWISTWKSAGVTSSSFGKHHR